MSCGETAWLRGTALSGKRLRGHEVRALAGYGFSGTARAPGRGTACDRSDGSSACWCLVLLPKSCSLPCCSRLQGGPASHNCTGLAGDRQVASVLQRWRRAAPKVTRFTWDDCKGWGALPCTHGGTGTHGKGDMPVLGCCRG